MAGALVTRLAPATLAILLALAPATASAAKKPRPLNGLIAFSANAILGNGATCGAPQIVTVRPDGSGMRVLTPQGCTMQTGCQQHFDPEWRPDGRRLAFVGVCPYRGTLLATPAGRIVERLPSPLPGIAYAPDGRRIAYHELHRETASLVFEARPDGSGRRLVGPGLAPSWSPRGTRIVYTATDGRIRIFYRRTGGKETLRAPSGSSPAWSPDGRTIAYVERSGSIRLMRPDASRQHTLPARATAVTWSPDGRWLAYDHSGDIVVSHANGSARRTIPVTGRGLQADYRISWQALPRVT